MSVLARDWLLDPTALLFLASLAVAFLAGGALKRRLARALPLLSLFALASAPAIVNPLVASLERRYTGVDCPFGGTLIVLGGGVDGRVADADEPERMRPATLARLAAAERIARAEPAVTVVLAGGGRQPVSEAALMARFLESRGLAPSRMVREERSSSTVDNAREVAALLGAGAGAAPAAGADAAADATGEAPADAAPPPSRLVTSALHMPRALASFRRAGIDVCPVAVGRISLTDVPPWALMPQTTALVKFDALLHELAALAFYRLRGWL